MNFTADILPWMAVVLLTISYWFQIYKIHIHKEVRDLSIAYHVCLVLGFSIMAYKAFLEGSDIFLIKQVATGFSVLIILMQIFYHRKDKWHDDADPMCEGCGKELELDWKHCPYCGQEK